MMRFQENRTGPYKFIHLSVMFFICVFMVVGAFSLQNNPKYHTPALLSQFKTFFYTAAYAASHALSAAETFGVMSVDNRNAQVPETRSVPVLVFHGITSEDDGSSINLTERQFRSHMFALKEAGYKTITLNELHAFISGNSELPEKTIMITFDDGRADSFYKGDPILSAVNYNAIMFAIAAYTKEAKPGGYYLTADEYTMLMNTGRWEIGSHSYDGHQEYPIDVLGNTGNFFSNHLWRPDVNRQESSSEFQARINNDFASSRMYFEELLGVPIASFAFPFGDLGQNQRDFREKTKEIGDIAKKNYDLLFYQYSPGEYFTQVIPRYGTEQSFLVRRIDMKNDWSSDELLSLLEAGEQKPLPYTDEFNNDNGWLTVWGEHLIENGTLTLRATGDQSGASTILDGTSSWVDYTVHARLISPNQTGVLLWTRFQNDDHNAACNFGIDFVHVEQTIDGEKRVIKGIRGGNYIPEGPFTITASVEGRSVICSINGVQMVRTEFLDPTLQRGGTGIKVWDETLGKSGVIVDELVVERLQN